MYEITENRTDGSIGIIVEVDVDKKVGIAGTVLILDGKLEGKKYITAGKSTAPLRIIENDKGEKITEAEPTTPVRIIGFDDIPPISAPVFIHDSKKEASQWIKNNENSEVKTVDTIEAEYIISFNSSL